MSDFDRRASPSRYDVMSFHSNTDKHVRLERRWWQGVPGWLVIRQGTSAVLAKDGMWEFEPPRSDYEHFWGRVSHPTAEEALATYDKVGEAA